MVKVWVGIYLSKRWVNNGSSPVHSRPRCRYLESSLNLDRSHKCLSSIKCTLNLDLDIAGFYSKDSHWCSRVHVGLDSRNLGTQNDFDRWIPSFDKGPRRIEQRFYMYKDCKNKCKLETSRLRGWLIDPFMKSTSKCDSKGCTALSVLMSRTLILEVFMEEPDTFQTEDFSAQ